MSKEIIEEKKGELKEAIKTLRNKEQELCDLQTKKEQLETGEVDLRSVQESKKRKSRTLIEFILGRATRADVDSADMAVSEAERDEKLSVEMIEAVVSSIKTTEADIQRLKMAVDVIRRGLFAAVYNELKSEIQATISDRVVAAVTTRSRYGISCADTMHDLFPGSMSVTILDEAAKAVEKEFNFSF